MTSAFLYQETDTRLQLGEEVHVLGALPAAWRNYYYGIVFTAQIIYKGSLMVINWLPDVKKATIAWNGQVIVAQIREVDTFTWTVHIHSSRVEIGHLYHNLDPVQMFPVPLRAGAYDLCKTDEGYALRCPYQTDSTKLAKGIGEMCRDIFKELGMKMYEYETNKEAWRVEGKPNTDSRPITIVWKRHSGKEKSDKKRNESSKKVHEETDEGEGMPEVTKKSRSGKNRDRRHKESRRKEKKTKRDKVPERKDPHDHIRVDPVLVPASALRQVYVQVDPKPLPPIGEAPKVRQAAIKSTPQIIQHVQIVKDADGIFQFSTGPFQAPKKKAKARESDEDYQVTESGTDE